jgi:hypothetical protein
MHHSRHSGDLGRIDWDAFGARIQKEVLKTGLGLRGSAKKWGGPSHATLSKVCNGRPCSVEMYLWFCRVFKIDPMRAYRRHSEDAPVPSAAAGQAPPKV